MSYDVGENGKKYDTFGMYLKYILLIKIFHLNIIQKMQLNKIGGNLENAFWMYGDQIITLVRKYFLFSLCSTCLVVF